MSLESIEAQLGDPEFIRRCLAGSGYLADETTPDSVQVRCPSRGGVSPARGVWHPLYYHNCVLYWVGVDRQLLCQVQWRSRQRP